MSAFIDFRHKAYQLTPHFLRKQAFLEWLYALIYPLRGLNDTFKSFADYNNYRLLFSSQTIYLERFLNNRYDNSNRGIYIETNNENDIIYFFNKAENEDPVYIFNNSEGEPPFYLFNNSEVLQQVNFIIYVPVAVSFDEAEFRSQVDFYNQAGKNYIIQTY